MRNVLGLSIVFLMCVVLSSCSGNRPEKAFMGTWEGTHEGETVELSFMEKGIWIVQLPEDTTSGTWTVDSEGNAVLTYEGGKVIATTMKDGRIIAREGDGSNAVVLEKTDKKK